VKKEKFPLERCLRLFPHLGDTGGFFVALLRKVAPLPSKAPPHPDSQNSSTAASAPIHGDNGISTGDSGVGGVRAGGLDREGGGGGGMRDGGKEHLMYRPLGDEGLRLVGRALGLDDKGAKRAAKALAPHLMCRSAAEAPPVVTSYICCIYIYMLYIHIIYIYI